MWIRSQNKETLVNADKLLIDEKHNKYTINFDTFTDSWYVLGTYKSKERALEVLDEAQEKIISFEFGKANKCLISSEVVYQMPKE